jgi:adenylosuccinate lyase
MKRNLHLTNGLLLSERVMFALADKIGKQTAHHVVYENCMKAVHEGRLLIDVLMEDERICRLINKEELKELLDPETYLGEAPQVVERVLDDARKVGILDE